MPLISKNVKCYVVHGTEEYAVRFLRDRPVVVYGEPGRKAHQGIAFADLETMEQVARRMLLFIEGARNPHDTNG